MPTTKNNPASGLDHRDRATTKSPEAFQGHASIRAWPGQRTRVVQPAPLTLPEMLDSYLLDCAARRLSPSTRDSYQQRLTPFLSFLARYGVVRPEQITVRAIRAYLASLQERQLRDSSIHVAASTIRAFCNFMVNEGVLDESPMRNVQMPPLSKRTLPGFTPEQVEKLITTCMNPRDRAICLFLVDTGCRSSEFVALNIEDVDLEGGVVQIRKGKGGNGREVFIGEATRQELARYLQGRAEAQRQHPLWVVGHTTTKRLTAAGLRGALRRIGQRAGVTPCYPLCFRRTFALWSLRAGIDIYCLQRIMGHSNLNMLERYLALTRDDVQEAHRKHGAVDSVFDGSLTQSEKDT